MSGGCIVDVVALAALVVLSQLRVYLSLWEWLEMGVLVVVVAAVVA
jgi:hypothetical protein